MPHLAKDPSVGPALLRKQTAEEKFGMDEIGENAGNRRSRMRWKRRGRKRRRRRKSRKPAPPEVAVALRKPPARLLVSCH